MKITMLKGLPGSGKSTWAKQFVAQNPNWVIVSKDSLRKMMGSYRPGRDEAVILQWRDSLISESLMLRKNVIVDDTNFHPKHEKRLREITGILDPLNPIELEIKFFDAPLEECIKNDLKRLESVGERVIRKMWKEYLYQKYTPPQRDPSLTDIIICDLDGTIALHNGRSPYDTNRCDTDLLNTTVGEILLSVDGRIIFVSGREEKCRDKTLAWLRLHFGVASEHLFMRKTGDFRKDDIIKEEIYLTQIMGKYNVKFVLDDRDRVVDMWRRNGLTCLQVAEGNF